jgi:hypothetical protein
VNGGNNRVWLAGLLAALAGVALVNRQRASGDEDTGATAPARTTPAAHAPAPSAAEAFSCDPSSDALCHVWQMLGEYFPASAIRACHDRADDPILRCLARESDLGAVPERAQTVIALVPDPADSPFDYTFDRALESIRGAVAREGFLSDKFHLPWERDGDPPNTSHREPGALLFRADGGARLLLVLLVGETPTKGVHRDALENAIGAATGPLCTTPISFLGPTYSGSITSLHNFLRPYFKRKSALPGCRADFVSGSATGTQNWERLKTLNDGSGSATPRVTYRTTILPDDAITSGLCKYLKGHLHVASDRIAFLSESNTSFGADFSQESVKKWETCDFGDVEIYPFPMHVSQVRTAHEKERTASAREAGDFPRRFLQLSLQDETHSHDTIPPVAQLTTASVDLQLAAMFQTICHRNIQYLGIVASDVKDIIALGEQARAHCPELRLFTYGPDVFFTHDDFASLRGMLIGTTYPLYTLNPDIVRDAIGPLHFPTDIAQGTYHAMRTLIAGHAPQYPMLSGIDEPFPLTWVSVVTATGFMPLAATRSADTVVTHVVRGEPARAQPAARPLVNGVMILTIVVLLFACGNAAAFLSVQQRGSAGWLAVFDLRSQELRAAKAVYCLVGLLTLYVASAVLKDLVQSTGLIALVVVVVAWLGIVAAVMIAMAPIVPGLGTWRWSLLLLPFLLCFDWLGIAASTHGVLDRLRAQQLTSGVSPLPPLLLMGGGLYLLMWFHLRRLRLRCLFSQLCGGVEAGIADAWHARFQDVHDRTERVWFLSRPRMIAVGALVLLPWAFIAPRLLVPFEGRLAGILMHLLFFVGYSAILFNLMRYWTAWRAYSRALRLAEMEDLAFLNAEDGPVRPVVARLGRGKLDLELRGSLERVNTIVNDLIAAAPGREGRLAAELAPACGYVNAQLSNILRFLTLAGLTLLLAAHCYPFEYEHALAILSWLVVLTVSVVAVSVIVQMNRDPLLSRLSGGRPGKLDIDQSFLSQTLLHGAVPILALVAARFPLVASFLSSWLTPVLRVFHR